MGVVQESSPSPRQKDNVPAPQTHGGCTQATILLLLLEFSLFVQVKRIISYL